MSTPPTDLSGLQMLADAMAQPRTPEQLREFVENYRGGKYAQRNGIAKRAHRAEVSLRGVCVSVEYFTEGEFLSATDTDAAEIPTARIVSAQIGGVECLRLLDSDALAERVERQWAPD